MGVALPFQEYGLFAPTDFEVVLFEGKSTDPAIPEHANAPPKVWTAKMRNLWGVPYIQMKDWTVTMRNRW